MTSRWCTYCGEHLIWKTKIRDLDIQTRVHLEYMTMICDECISSGVICICFRLQLNDEGIFTLETCGMHGEEEGLFR